MKEKTKLKIIKIKSTCLIFSNGMKKNLFLSILTSFLTPLLVFAVDYVPLAPIEGYVTQGTVGAGLEAYIANMYRLGVGIATLLAVLMVIWGGVEYMTTDAWGHKEEGKERIQSALFGLMLALGSYVIIATIDKSILDVDFDMLSAEDRLSVEDQFSLSVPGQTRDEFMKDSRPQGAWGTSLPDPDSDFYTGNSFVSDGMKNVRSTYYYAGEKYREKWTDAGESSTGIPLRAADNNTVGVAAVDPSLTPYGSAIILNTSEGKRVYIAGDTGSAVVSRKASQGKAPVVDFYSNKQVGNTYQDVQVVRYTGAKFTSLSDAQKSKVIADIKSTHLSN